MFDPLFDLHDLDVRVDELNHQIQALFREYHAAEDALKVAERQREEAKGKQQAAQLNQRRLEKETEALQQKIQTTAQKIMQVTSPKQLTALENENEGNKKRFGELEDELLAAYGLVEEADSALSTSAKKADDDKEKLGKLRTASKEKVAGLKAEVARVSAQKAAAEAQVDAGLLRKYQALRERYKGRVLFKIEDNGCMGCGIPQGAGHFQKIKKSTAAPQECQSCGRLLVYVGPTDD